MKKFLLHTGLVLSTMSQAQVIITDTVDVNGPGVLSSEKYLEIITRQSSCSVFLSNFELHVTEPEPFMVNIIVSFRCSDPGASNNGVVCEKQIVLEETIEDKEGKNDFVYTINNVKIVDQQVLTGISDIEVKVVLVPIDRGKVEIFNMLKPLLNQIVPLGEPVSQVLTSALEQSRRKTDKPDMVFYTTIQVAENMLEFNRISADTNLITLRNHHRLGLIFEGEKSISFGPNILGTSAEFLNGITQFVCGKVVVPRSEVKFDGLAEIYFTKDKNGTIPFGLLSKLEELDALMKGADFVNNKDRITFKCNEISSSVTTAVSDRTISKTTAFSINMYNRLAQVYMDYQLQSATGSTAWVNKFRSFYNDFIMQGAANGSSATGVTGIYTNKIAVVLLPYSLPDDYLLAMYGWQLTLHSALAESKNVTFAR